MVIKMENIELLSPAGSFESLIAAIQNGADAVYLSGSLYGARSYAANFDKEMLLKAIHYAHLYGVKVYVTINTLIYDHELNELFDYIGYLYRIHADALIVQDYGVLSYIKKRFPDFEVHASTQMSVTNLYGVNHLKAKGVSRVVLARENSVDEIKYITDHSDTEIEAFVHGALCVGYSGQCLMSSSIGQRSGNRGKCAQPCRLPYRLLKDDLMISDGYLLSPKDLNSIHGIQQLIDANIKSFKIEGRMKRPEYVASITRGYRQALDNQSIKSETVDEFSKLFNRGFTEGYLLNSDNVMNFDYPANLGLEVGKIKYYDMRRKKLGISLSEDLYQGDSIRVGIDQEGFSLNRLYLNTNLVSNASKNENVEIDYYVNIDKGTIIYRTGSIHLLKELQNTYNKNYRRIKVKIEATFYKGKQATLCICDELGNNASCHSNEVCQAAISTPLTKERIINQLMKLGDSIYSCKYLNILMDEDINISIKEINEMRRICIYQLNELRTNCGFKEDLDYPTTNPLPLKKPLKAKKIAVSVNNIKQLKLVIDMNVHIVYYPLQSDSLEAYHFAKMTDKEFCLVCSRINKDSEIEKLKKSGILDLDCHYVVHDYGMLELLKDKKIIIGKSLNVVNSLTANAYKEYRVQLSNELNVKSINYLYDYAFETEVLVYGRVENMISEYCPVSYSKFGCKKKKCNLCKRGSYALKDRYDAIYPLSFDENCRTHIYHHTPIQFEDVNSIKADSIRLDFIDETNEQIIDRINVYNQIINDKLFIKSNNKQNTGFFKKDLTKDI